MVTAQKINKAYQQLAIALEHHAARAIVSEDARIFTESHRLRLLADGTIDGRNEELRAAQAQELLGAEYAVLRELEIETIIAKTELDLARLEVERVRALLRLDELESGLIHIHTERT